MLKKSMEYVGEYKVYTYRAIVLIIIAVICSVIPYFAVYMLIDALLMGREVTAVFAVSVFAAALLGMLLQAVFNVEGLQSSHIAAYHTLENLRISLQGKLEKMPLGVIQAKGTGGLKKVFVDDIEQVELILAHAIPEGIGNMCIPMIIYIVMFFKDWKLGLLSLASLPIGFLAMGMMFKIGMKDMDNYYASGKKMNDTIVEYVNGMEVIKVFNRDGESYRTLAERIHHYRDFTLAWYKACWPWMAVYSAVIPCIAFVMLPVGSYLVLQGSCTLSNLVLVLCLSFAIGPPILRALSFAGKFPHLNFLIEKLEADMAEEPLRQTEDEFSGDGFDITLSNVTFSYGDADVIRDVSLRFRQGTLNALVGESGSGKSTLAKLLVHFYDIKSGSIQIGGQDITKMSLEALSSQISYVAQEQFLFNMSLLENIRLGRADATDEEVMAAAEKAQCREFLDRIEGGIHALAGDSGKQLSGGERQRISLARAILKDAPVIVLDEATAFMDPENEAAMNRAIAEVIRDKTVIVIAHHLQSVTGADQICVMKDGSVDSVGTHKELLAGSDEYRNLWRIAESAAAWGVSMGGAVNVCADE